MSARLPLPRQLACAAAVIWLGAGSVAIAGQIDSQECQRDALVMRSVLHEARYKLEQASRGSETDRCRAWRGQIAAARKAIPFYTRCLTPPDRERSIENAKGMAEEYQSVVAQRCDGR